MKGKGRPALPADLARVLAEDRLLTAVEAAGVLGVPVYTYREWTRRGLLPSIVLGRHRFIRATTLHKWIAANERAAGGGNG